METSEIYGEIHWYPGEIFSSIINKTLQKVVHQCEYIPKEFNDLIWYI